MVARDCESRVFLKVRVFTTYAIHHYPVVGGKGSVGNKREREYSSPGLLRRDIFFCEFRDGRQCDFFRSPGSDERIHEVPPVHSE